MFRASRWNRFALLLASALGCRTVPAVDPFETIERSTLYDSTSTAPVGVLEVEVGGAFDPGDGTGTSIALTYGLSSSTEVFAELQPYVEVERPGTDGRGFGDVVVGVKTRLVEESHRPSFAVELTGKLPTADEDEGLGSGEVDLEARVLATKSVGSAVLTVSLGLTALGEPPGAGFDLEPGASAMLATTLRERLAVFAGWSGARDVEADRTSQTSTVGLALGLSERLLLDLAGELGLDDESPDATLFVGLTVAF